MTIKELETAKKFIHSNNSFYSGLISGKIPTIDTPLKLELILLYLSTNIEALKSLSLFNIIELISSQDYILDDETINFRGTIISIDYLVTITDKVEGYKKRKHNVEKVIDISNYREWKEPTHIAQTNAKVIPFDKAKKDIFLTMRDRANIYERTNIIDKDTKPYLEEVRTTFQELLDDMLIKLINDNLRTYNFNYLKVLYSYLSLYPLTRYLVDKVDIPFERITLPQDKIGLRKTTYANSYIYELENLLSQINGHKLSLVLRKQYLTELTTTTSKEINKIEENITAIDKEALARLFELYLIKTSPDVYNENLLRYIVASFEQGNVEINKLFKNPIVKLFYIEDGKTMFYCALHLSTFTTLLDSKQLLELLSKGKELKREVKL